MIEDDLARLEKALAKGVRTVTFADGRSVTYASFEELMKRITYVRQSLGKATAEKRLLGKYTKGIQA